MEQKHLEVAGVYYIKNESNNRFYIGSSCNVGQRLISHMRSLKYDKHDNKELQQDFSCGHKIKYGLLIEAKDSYTTIENNLLYLNRHNENLYNKTIRHEMPYIDKLDKEKFYKSIVKTKECWVWQNKPDEDGYGIIGIQEDEKRYKIKAHRLSYFLYYNVDPFCLQVCHSCDNKLCVNPQHLFLGTDQDNIRDYCLKHNKSYKLTDLNKKKIDNFIKLGYNDTDISKMLDIKTDRSTISRYRKCYNLQATKN